MRHSTGQLSKAQRQLRRRKAVISLASAALILAPAAPVIAEVLDSTADVHIRVTAAGAPDGAAWSVDLDVTDGAGGLTEESLVGAGGSATEVTLTGLAVGTATLQPSEGTLNCPAPDADPTAEGYQIDVAGSGTLACTIDGLAFAPLQTLAAPDETITPEPVAEPAPAPEPEPAPAPEPAVAAVDEAPAADVASEDVTSEDPSGEPAPDPDQVLENPAGLDPAIEESVLPEAAALDGSLMAPMVANSDFFPTTAFQLDGNQAGPNDWGVPFGTAFYGPYETAQEYPSSGIVSSTRGRDNCTPSATDFTIISPGTKVNDLVWGRSSGKPNEKSDICSSAAAIEVVNVDGDYHYIYYSMWTRSPEGSGDLSVYSVLEGPVAGRSDDRLIEFDYNPNDGTATVRVLRWSGTAWVITQALNNTMFAYAIGSNTETQDGGLANANTATFGEFAVNLTTAGVLPPDECNTFSATSAITRTGNSDSANLQDYIDYAPAMTLLSCNTINVEKEVLPVGAEGGPFTYVISRETGMVHDDTLKGDAGEPDLDTTMATITGTLTIPGDPIDRWDNVVAAPNYRLQETVLPPGWALNRITCDYYDIFAQGWKTAIVYENGKYLEGFELPSGTLADPTSCTIVNETSTLRIAKAGLGDGAADFTFTVTDQPDQILSLGETSGYMQFTPGTTVSLAETLPATGLPWEQLGVSCVNDATGAVVADGPAGTVDVTTVGGANVTCTFTNQQQAQIRVAKVADGSTDSFDFTWTGVPGATTDSLAHNETSEWYTVAPNARTLPGYTPGGAYSVAEQQLAGYQLASVICSNGTSMQSATDPMVANYLAAPGESVTCTFVNVPTGSLTIIKNAVPNHEQDFTFETTGTGLPGTFLLDDDSDPALPSTRTFPNLANGTYTITETDIPAGWSLTDLACAADGTETAITTDLETGTATIGMNGETVTCTFTNTLATSTLALTKAWENDVAGDEVGLSTVGTINTTTATGRSIAGGAEPDTTTPATRTIYAGETVTLSENFVAGGARYNASLACYAADVNGAPAGDPLTALTYTELARTGTFQVPDAPVPVVCVFSNTAKTATLNLHKDWGTSPVSNDTATLTIASILGTVTADNTNDRVDTDFATSQVVLGSDVRISELLTNPAGPSGDRYITDLLCTVDGENYPVNYNPGATAATLLPGMDLEGKVIDCTFSNTRRHAVVTFLKVWGNGAPGDQATLVYDGIDKGTGIPPHVITTTSTVPAVGGTPAWASTYVDELNKMVVNVYGGEIVHFSESLPTSNAGTYDSSIRCVNEVGNQILGLQGRDIRFPVPERLFANAIDNNNDGTIALTCYVSNLREAATLDVAKTWVDGVADDTAVLAAEDLLLGGITVPDEEPENPGDPVEPAMQHKAEATSTSTGAAGTAIDNTNVASIATVTGGTVRISEILGADNIATYSTGTPVCTYTGVDPETGAAVTGTLTPAADADTESEHDYLVTIPQIAGVHVSCMYTNEAPRGTIVVVKNVLGADGTFDFTKTWDGATGVPLVAADGFSLTTVDGTASTTWTNVLAGTYTVAEVDDSAAFDFTNLTCVDSDGDGVTSTVSGLTGTINLDANETVTCTYTNTEKSTLVVIKDAVPDDAQDFAFTTTGPAGAEIGGTLASFSLDDDADPTLSNTNTGLVSGGFEYTVTESPTTGWSIDADSVCTAIDTTGTPVNVPIDPETGAVAVTPLPGATVTCTFINVAAPSTLLLSKQVADTTPADLPWSFQFSLTPHDPATLTVSGTGPVDQPGEGQVEIADLVLNQQYSLAELPTQGWTMGTLTCTINGEEHADEDTAAAGYQFTVTEPESEIACAITNTPILPQLTLLKTVVNTGTAADAVDTDWTLTATGPTADVTGIEGDGAITAAEVLPGTYTLSESGGPAYYTAGAWQCWNVDANDVRGDVFDVAGSDITLALADRVECEIVNTAIPGTYTIAKGVDTDGDGVFDDDGATVKPGDTLTYQLSVTHTSGAPISGISLTDNVTAILANATLGTLPAGVTLSGTTLTWAVPTLSTGTLTVTYQATVKAGAWGVSLKNAVTGGPCEEDCETENPTPAYTLTKSSVPVDGSTVEPGETVVYTLTVKNTSDAILEGFAVTDNLANVLNNAELAVPLAGGLTLAGTTLTWAIPTLAPDATATVSYTVTINDGAWGVTIGNVATPGDGGECVIDCDTEHPTPEYSLTKFSDPGSGSTVEPGDTITYYLRAENTSDAILEGHTATDDVSDVLTHATLGALNSALTLDGTTLTWAIPTLAPDQAVTISFTAVVNEGEWGVSIRNVATPDDAGECPPDECTTEHPTPSYTLAKSSDPADGTTVKAGQTVTYTLTATNTSEGVLTGAIATDDLSDILDNATLTQPLASGLTLTETTLTWAIPVLEPGKSVTVSYTVTVMEKQVAQTLRNVVTPSDGGECPPDECTTEHPIPSYTLTKTSDPKDGSTVNPGSRIAYTLTVTNTGLVPLTGATVTDNMVDVLDDSAIVQPLASGLTLTGSTLTWAVPDVAVGETATVTYTVTVGADQWSQTLRNVATPDKDGQCVVDCSTEHTTPPAPIVPPPPPPPPLPATGADTLPLAGLSLGMLIIGAGIYASSQRVRRT